MQSAFAMQGVEGVHEISDPSVGLSGVVAIHSLRLGPAAGGCRMWRYADAGSLRRDAQRLAEGMSYKNALAGLPLGGGKAVLQRPEGDFDRARYFEAFGRAIEDLCGAYVTAEDVGTNVADMACVARATTFVAGLPTLGGQVGGDPSPWTARGVFLGLQASVERRLGRSLDDVAVAVQGLGNVGYALCALLHGAGARLVVADTCAEIARKAEAEFGAISVTPDRLLATPADVLAPCALGGVLDEASIAALQVKVVCGAANNQLATPEDGARLARKGVLYAPDYVVNAGGIINVAAEYLGWTPDEAARRIDAIPQRLAEVIETSERLGIATNAAADALACELIGGRQDESSTQDSALGAVVQ